MGFVADSVAVFGDGHTSEFFDPIVIIAHGGLGVCDGAHTYFVMKKKVRGQIVELGMLAAPAGVSDEDERSQRPRPVAENATRAGHPRE
jgi:hypothetical protein